jgi:HEAT repeat protein
MLSFAAAFVMKRAFSPLMDLQNKMSSGHRQKVGHNAEIQKQAEELLRQLAAGDSSAADKISQNASSWVGKIARTKKTDQFVTAAINLPDLHSREAALEAELALDGIAKNETGLRFLTDAAGDPTRRVWALWLLGALGNRGVDPMHTAKILESYLADPNVNVRASAVNGLSLVGTDETIPVLLDRFRNDSSPVVQERAACGIAESGMYTKPQRMQAAASLINWLDDPLVKGQQRAWDMQALGDISGRHLGADSAAWRSWYESALQ